MTLAQLVPIGLEISIALIVIGLALETAPGDISYLIRRPALMIRSLLAMNVVMPVLAATAAGLLHLLPEVKVALVLLSVSPVPPVLPNKQAKAGANRSYAVGLLALSALVSIVTVPATIAIIGRVAGRTVDVPMALVAKTVAASVLVPLAVGALIARVAPATQRAARAIGAIGTLLLALSFLPVLLGSWRSVIGEIGHGTLVAIAAFTVAGLAVGHVLGGPAPEDRTVLGLSTAARHPGVAMAVAGAVAEDPKAVAAAVLLSVVVGGLVCGPYVSSRKRAAVAPEPVVAGVTRSG